MPNRSTGGNSFITSDTAKNPGSGVSVGTSSSVIVPANGDRIELNVINDHATQIVYLRLDGGPAVVGQGIRLNAAGGSWTTQAYQGPVSAIATGVATGVTIAEV